MAMDVEMPIHPDDVLFFTEVTNVMRAVAKEYHLPLRQVQGLPMPTHGMANRMGDCHYDGTIRLVMRCTVDGEWCADPLSPKEIWDTAAHELAHLKHMNHGVAFQEFYLELCTAISNRQVNHRQKVIDRLVKMQASRDSEMKLGNEEAAEAFAGAVNRMLIEYELNPSDLDYARTADSDPVIEMYVDLAKYEMEKKKKRIAWQETLAMIVAQSHLCSFLIHRHSNQIVFVGTKSHATVAEYVYGILIHNAYWMAKTEAYHFKLKSAKEGNRGAAHGYGAAWLDSFVRRVEQRLAEARRAAVAAATSDVPGGESQALMRLNQALVKTRQYVENKFAGRKSTVKMLNHNADYHPEGSAAGKAAADRMPIGRKGLNTGRPTKGSLGE